MTNDPRHCRYFELPVVEGAPPRSAWGLWGAEDQLGMLNRLTDDRTLEAIREVRTGSVYSLGLPMDEPWRPPGSRRGNPEYFMQWVGMPEPARSGADQLPGPPGLVEGRDSYLSPVWLEGSSHWDGLTHVRHPDYGNYNGVPDSCIHGNPGAKLGVDQWTRRGIVGRGVLVDVARYCTHAGRPFAPTSNYAITVADLQGALDSQSVAVKPGDILLIHTGWMQHYRTADEAYRRSAYTPEGMRTPGLAAGDDMLEFLWDLQLAALTADNTSVQQVPSDDGTDWRLHSILLPLWGLPTGGSWHLHDLAEACEADGNYSFLLVSVPLNVRGGTGSPPNAVAIK